MDADGKMRLGDVVGKSPDVFGLECVDVPEPKLLHETEIIIIKSECGLVGKERLRRVGASSTRA